MNDLNEIEESPDIREHCTIWAKKKDTEKTSSKKNKDVASIEVCCELESCKLKKIKDGEPVLTKTTKDFNKKTAKKHHAQEQHFHLKCALDDLLSSGRMLDTVDGWDNMTEKEQDNATKIYWKENAKLKKRERTASQRTDASNASYEAELEEKMACAEIEA